MLRVHLSCRGILNPFVDRVASGANNVVVSRGKAIICTSYSVSGGCHPGGVRGLGSIDSGCCVSREAVGSAK